MPINSKPRTLRDEIERTVRKGKLHAPDIAEIQRQLLGWGAQAAPEVVVESFYRCLLTDKLQRRFKIERDDLPSCINSSHKAASLVCSAVPPHDHKLILDPIWRAAWRRMRKQHRRVDMYVRVGGRRSLRRADLYVIADGKIVSVEFKYADLHGVRDPKAVAKQMQLYVKNHKATLLVIYSGSEKGTEVKGVKKVREALGSAAPVVLVYGPAIPKG